MTGVPRELQEKLGATYSFQRELSGGGMARVFVAKDVRLGRNVVVKVLSPELAAGVSADRFQREIRTSATLQQANIVPLLDAGDADGTAWFTMPYIEGESLRVRLDKSGALPVADVVSILRDVSRALAYAHEHGVIHRDIKPDNILISGAAAVVTDFGLAKAIAESRRTGRDGVKEGTITQLGTAVGTPAYMAPEQVAADPHVDERADIYAVGCTAYEMLTGAPPFASGSVQQMLAAHIDLEPRHVEQLRPKAPRALADVVMQCLEKDPADRPTASQLLQRLETISDVRAPERTVNVTTRAFALYAGAFVVVAALARIAISVTGLPDWVFAGALIVMALGLPVLILTAFGASRHLSWKRATLGGVMALVSFIVIVAGYMLLRSLGIGPAGSLLAAGRMQAKQPVLVADFRSLGPDTTLGSVIGEAIRADLNQSSAVRLVTSQQVNAALARMQRKPGERLEFPVAQELAKREGIGAIVDGEVRPLGAGFLVSIRLVETDSGRTLAAFQDVADSPSRLIATVGSLSRKLRAKIGESLKDVRESPPLERVTTSSLAALEKHTQALHALDIDDLEQFARYEEAAISLDTGFAMAYRRYGLELTNFGGQEARVRELLEKAVEHSDRLPPMERYLTLGSYAMLPDRPEWDKAYDAFSRAIDLDPDNYIALNNAGLVRSHRRDWKGAVELYERSKAANPLPSIYLNLIIARFALGGLPATDSTFAELRQRYPASLITHAMHAFRMVASGKRDSAAKVLMAEPPREPSLFMLATLRKSEGRMVEGADFLRRWSLARKSRGVRNADIQIVLDRAWMEGWTYGQKTRAAALVDSVVASPAYDSLPVTERLYDYVATILAMAGRADRARAVLAAAERVNGWSVTRAELGDNTDRYAFRHISRGWIAMAERRYTEAVAQFRASDAGECVTCQLPLLAMAYDSAGQVDSALSVYTRFVDIPELFRQVDGDFLAAAYKRLGELHEARGEPQQAAIYYLKFVDLWKNADPPLQPAVAEVRRRLTRLGDVERSGRAR